jgi:cytochrome c oxidase cbb3-type subunit IV
MHLDVTVVLRSVVTIVWFLTFVGLVLWAWSGRRGQDFATAARLPFDDVDAGSPEGTAASDEGGR